MSRRVSGRTDAARVRPCAAADVHPAPLRGGAPARATCRCCGPDFAPDQEPAARPGPWPRSRAGGRGAPRWPPRRCWPTWRRGPARPCAHAGGAAPDLRLPRRSRASTEHWEAFLTEELGARGQRPAAAVLAAGRGRWRGARSAARSSAPGASGLAAAHRLRQAGVDGHGLREERRRGRHLARERLPGLPGRRAQPALQLLLRPDQRLGLAVLGAARPAGLPPGDGQGARAGRVHPLRAAK